MNSVPIIFFCNKSCTICEIIFVVSGAICSSVYQVPRLYNFSAIPYADHLFFITGSGSCSAVSSLALSSESRHVLIRFLSNLSPATFIWAFCNTLTGNPDSSAATNFISSRSFSSFLLNISKYFPESEPEYLSNHPAKHPVQDH